jgi:DNA polymerase-1
MTATGRYVCTDPPVQTYPPKARRIFIAPRRGDPILRGNKWIPCLADMYLGYYDLSQIEFRIMIWASDDPVGKELLSTGRDIHREVATQIYRKAYEDVTAMERFLTKFTVYGLGYGRRYWSIAEQYKVALSEAKYVEETFFQRFSRLMEWRQGQYAYAKEHRITLPNAYGRTRFLLDESEDELEREAYNFFPTSTAHDLLEDIHWDIDQEVSENEFAVIADYHDALLGEQPTQDKNSQVIAIFEKERLPGLVTPVGVKVGTNFGQLDDRG